MRPLPPSFQEFQAYGAYLANASFQNDVARQVALKQTAQALGVLGGIAVAAAAGIGFAIGTSLFTVAAGVFQISAFVTAAFPFASPSIAGNRGGREPR